MLMTHSKTSVNAVNKTGHTALHFAALNGHYFLVELILSHQFVDTVRFTIILRQIFNENSVIFLIELSFDKTL